MSYYPKLEKFLDLVLSLRCELLYFAETIIVARKNHPVKTVIFFQAIEFIPTSNHKIVMVALTILSTNLRINTSLLARQSLMVLMLELLEVSGRTNL